MLSEQAAGLCACSAATEPSRTQAFPFPATDALSNFTNRLLREHQGLHCSLRSRELSLCLHPALWLQVVVRSTLFEDRGVALILMIPLLPSLAELDISYDGDAHYDQSDISDHNGLPRCKELAELHSCSLTSLRVCMLDGPADGNTLRLSRLPQLRSFHVAAEPHMPLHLRIDAASLGEVPQLQALHICYADALRLQQGSLTQLTSLTALTLRGCGLRSVPADVASLGATLLELDLSNNDRMQIDGAAAADFLQCSRLNVLNVYKMNIQLGWQDKLHEF